MNNGIDYILDWTTISPTPLTNPQEPYYEWIQDIYGVVVRRSNIQPTPTPTPDPPVGDEYYYYLGTDGSAYADSEGNLYTWKEND